MTWYWAVLITLGALGFWAVLPLVADVLDKAFQRRMAATLWRSLPYDPGPEQLDRDFRRAARQADEQRALEEAGKA